MMKHIVGKYRLATAFELADRGARSLFSLELYCRSAAGGYTDSGVLLVFLF